MHAVHMLISIEFSSSVVLYFMTGRQSGKGYYRTGVTLGKRNVLSLKCITEAEDRTGIRSHESKGIDLTAPH